MINVKDQVYEAIKDITANVSDTYPKDWAQLPAIQYTEEDNSVVEWVDNKESKAHLLYKVDIWNNASTSEAALKVEAAKGGKRTMLANGATLGYKKKGSTEDYTNLTGLKEIPELGDDPEKVENTGLADKVKQYEFGIGDAGDLTYKFKYENTSEDSPYRVMRKAGATKEVLSFCEELPDGTRTD